MFWPYWLVTGIFGRLLDRHATWLSIETKTLVTAIEVSRDSDAAYPYVLTIPRGTVRAGQIFHCVSGEWVAAGFNGYSMSQCWSCGEAIALMALGQSKPHWLPDPYLSSEWRLGNGAVMDPEAALMSFFQRS